MKFNNSQNNPITKYNSQYLKCIVTKYKSSIKLLANSGSLIILKPNDNIDRSYIYLGNTFLASGYGFENEELLNDAIRITEDYDKQINELKDKDNSLEQNIIDKYQYLLNELKKYVQRDAQDPNDGDISNAYIKFNADTLHPTYVKLIDVINHGYEAQYDDIEIKRIKKTIITKNNEFYSLDDLNSSDTHEETMQSSIINVPIGTIIKKIKIDIEYDPHDSGGISKLIVGYKDQSSSSKPKNIYIEYDGNAPTQLTDYTYSKTFILDLTSPGLDPYIVKDKDIDIISNISAIIEKTPSTKYKNYPELESNFGISIKSTSNIIHKHETHNLALLTVHPSYYIKYYINTTNTNDYSYNSFNNHSNLLNDDNFINEYIPIDANTKKIVIAVPSIYKIINLSYIPNSNDNYNGNEEYNWSGASDIKNNINIAYNSIYLTCDIYNIIIQPTINSSNQLTSGKIKLTLMKTSNQSSIQDNGTSESDYITKPSKRFSNELFDSIYWVDNDINKLNEIYRNGLDIKIINS